MNIFGVDSELIGSGGGVFEVKINDQLIFSKKNSGKFVENDEVVNFIQGLEEVT